MNKTLNKNEKMNIKHLLHSLCNLICGRFKFYAEVY